MLKNQMEEDTAESASNVFSNLNILLIEDSETDAYIIRRVLGSHMRHPCCVVHAESMASAEAILGKQGNQDSIDLILLDLGLPDTANNDETFARMNDIKEKIPVIILTNLQDHEFALSTMNAGAEDYVVKSTISQSPDVICDAIDFAVCRHKRIEEIHQEADNELKEKDMVIRWMSGDYNCTKTD